MIATILFYVLLLPTDLLVGFPAGLIARAAWGTSSAFHDGAWWVTVKRASWLGRTFVAWGAVTMGHVVVVFDDQTGETNRHELTHVRQEEGNALAGAVLLLVLVWWVPLQAVLVWVTMPWLVYLASGLHGLLTGRGFYAGNDLEIAAYDHAAETKS